MEDNHELKMESKNLNQLQDQKAELLAKVQTLKAELQDWRSKLDSQVKTYRTEIGEIRRTLNTEIEVLRNDFHDLRTNLKQQLEIAAGLAAQDVVLEGSTTTSGKEAAAAHREVAAS